MSTDEAITINMLTTTHELTEYGAGTCYVTIGHGPQQRAVALKAGIEGGTPERRITTLEHAPEWLAERGLPRDVAERLVADAWARKDPA